MTHDIEVLRTWVVRFLILLFTVLVAWYALRRIGKNK